ncbi:MAG TPA: methyltransferase domain-containing protein [Kineosporiaceae bacterium]|nr:methyltransferase domain-containing protein [Kineosporiaceae bacterium]
MNDLARFQHPRFASAYARTSLEADERGASEHRRRLLAGVRGVVVEVGAGNGRNFPLYPVTVTRVVAVEPDDTLRSMAERAARTASVSIEVLAGDADHLPVADAAADVVVTSLVLCSVPDQARALAEIARVLHPGGELRYYEHVRSARRWAGVLEDLVAPVWALAAAGCHPNRRTSEAIRAAGFVVEREERFTFRPLRGTPPSDHLVGVARRPAWG